MHSHGAEYPDPLHAGDGSFRVVLPGLVRLLTLATECLVSPELVLCLPQLSQRGVSLTVPIDMAQETHGTIYVSEALECQRIRDTGARCVPLDLEAEALSGVEQIGQEEPTVDFLRPDPSVDRGGNQ